MSVNWILVGMFFLLLYYYLKSCKIKKVESEVKLLRLWCECVLSWSFVVQKGEREIFFFKGSVTI